MFSNAAYVRTIEEAAKQQRLIHNKIWLATSEALEEIVKHGKEANIDDIADQLNLILAELGRRIVTKE